MNMLSCMPPATEEDSEIFIGSGAEEESLNRSNLLCLLRDVAREATRVQKEQAGRFNINS